MFCWAQGTEKSVRSAVFFVSTVFLLTMVNYFASFFFGKINGAFLGSFFVIPNHSTLKKKHQSLTPKPNLHKFGVVRSTPSFFFEYMFMSARHTPQKSLIAVRHVFSWILMQLSKIWHDRFGTPGRRHCVVDDPVLGDQWELKRKSFLSRYRPFLKGRQLLGTILEKRL